MSVSIQTTLQTIEKSLPELDSTTGMKKKVAKYNELTKQLESCRVKINAVYDEFTKWQPQNLKCITDDKEYDALIVDIGKLEANIKDDSSIETIIEVYKSGLTNIVRCEEYLKTKKMELINVE